MGMSITYFIGINKTSLLVRIFDFSFWSNTNKFYSSPYAILFYSCRYTIINYYSISIKTCPSNSCIKFSSICFFSTNQINHGNTLS